MRSRSRLLPRLLPWLLALATGCPALDASQPIALVPDPDFAALDRVALTNAAECWNLEFGTRLTVGASNTIVQQVEVGYSDLICLYASGRTETTLPVSVHVCPPAYNDSFLFLVLLHELGHVLNIRPHADDPAAVMAASGEGRGDALPETFAPEDRQLFRDWNEGANLPPGCRVRIDGWGCSCP